MFGDETDDKTEYIPKDQNKMLFLFVFALRHFDAAHIKQVEHKAAQSEAKSTSLLCLDPFNLQLPSCMTHRKLGTSKSPTPTSTLCIKRPSAPEA